MLSLEQVKLLDTKVARAVEYVDRLSGENAALRKKFGAAGKRIEELEALVTRFKEEQGRIEDGILSALDRLSQFESAIEKSLAGRSKASKPAAAPHNKPEPAEGHAQCADVSKKPNTEEITVESVIPDIEPLPEPRVTANKNSCSVPGADIQDPLELDMDLDAQPDSADENFSEPGELDIF